MDQPFVLEQFYNSPIEKVWQGLTELNAMKAWYFPQLQAFKPIVGFYMKFSDDGSAYKKHWCVTAVVPGKKLAHSWSYEGYFGSSEVIFELFEAQNGTLFRITHTGLASFPNDPHFARARFEAGWKHIISDQFKHYLEEK
jgi:uncharacterized protein YndB with AHSA1/START domain